MRSECMDGKAIAFFDEDMNGSWFFDTLALFNGKYEMIYLIGCSIQNFSPPKNKVNQKIEFFNCMINTPTIQDVIEKFPNANFPHTSFNVNLGIIRQI